MTAPTFALNIVKGKTLEQPLLYAENFLVYAPIEALPSVAPVRVTITNHGIPDDWPVRVQGVAAPVELNTAQGITYPARIIDANTVELNALDGSGWVAFTVSGHLVYTQPADITGWEAHMQIRDRLGGTMLLDLSSNPADNADGTITIDVANSAFVLGLTAAQTAAIPWNGAVYDIEAIRPDGKVVSIIAPSPVIAGPEVTVWT